MREPPIDAIAVRRTADGQTDSNALDFRVVPIVFVPGVMGSRLQVKGGVNWDPESTKTMLQWVLMGIPSKVKSLAASSKQVQPLRELPSDVLEEAPGMIGDWENRELCRIAFATTKYPEGSEADVMKAARGFYEKRGWGGVAWTFYGAFLTELETSLNFTSARFPWDLVPRLYRLPNPVHAYGYDWRGSISESAKGLRKLIADVLKTHSAKQVIVVTHSMGGLVARAALLNEDASLPQPGTLDSDIVSKIAAVVHGAQPSNGAVVAYRRFFTGATKQLDGWAPSAIGLEMILGTTPVDYTTLLAYVQGPAELLPNAVYHHFDDDVSPMGHWLRDISKAPPLASPGIRADGPRQPDLDKIYGSEVYGSQFRPPGLLLADWTESALPAAEVNAQLKERLRVAGKVHGWLNDAAHPNTYVLYSRGLPTEVRVRIDTGVVTGDRGPPGDGGDGTVPAVSGKCPHLPKDSVKSLIAIGSNESPGPEHTAVYSHPQFSKAAIDILKSLML